MHPKFYSRYISFVVHKLHAYTVPIHLYIKYITIILSGLQCATKVNPLTHISRCAFVHPNRISQKTGSITHASRKTFVVQEALAQ